MTRPIQANKLALAASKFVVDAAKLLFICWAAMLPGCSGNSGVATIKKDDTGVNGKGRNISTTSQLNAELLGILKAKCASCHTPPASDKKKGAIKDILDLNGLIDDEFVIAGSKKSPLLKSVKDKSMPPGSPLSASEITTIETWIMDGAVVESVEARTFIPEHELFRIAAEDLLGKVDASDRSYTRYFSALHSYNAGADGDLIASFGPALSKLTNSLSQKTSIKPVHAVRADLGLYRIDIRDYGWKTEQWEHLIRTYPYLIVPQDSKGLAVLQSDSKTNVPLVRADWFLANAARAPLYYDFLDMPDQLAKFEQKFGIDSASAIKNGEAARAGFNNSGISKQNRVIERVASGKTVLWRSYEFGTSDGVQNILERPLGPALAGWRFPAQEFREDGGEFIVTLPNGMIAFYLAGRNKKRMSKVPSDPGERELFAGITCMSCHAGGFLYRKDMVREQLNEGGALTSVASEVERLYAPEAEFKKLMEKDTDGYRAALKAAGVDPDKLDPINRVTQSYLLSMSFAQVAAELGVEVNTLKDALDSESALAEISDLFSDGKLQRSEFSKHFQTLVSVLKP